jgi:hypothetical protein
MRRFDDKLVFERAPRGPALCSCMPCVFAQKGQEGKEKAQERNEQWKSGRTAWPPALPLLNLSSLFGATFF